MSTLKLWLLTSKSALMMWQSPRPSPQRANQKPWMTAEVRGLLKTRDEAFRSGDKAALKTARANLSCGIKNAKRSYAQKINNHFTDSRDTRSLWQAIQTITDYKPPPQGLWWGHIPPRCTQPLLFTVWNAEWPHLHKNYPHLPTTGALCLSPADVRKTLSRINPRKAAGPDNIPGRVLKDCAAQLTDVLTDIFNTSLSQAVVPHMSQIHNNHTGTKEITCVLSKWLPSHSTDSNHDEVLWEVSHEQHQKQPPQHTWPAAVCIPSKTALRTMQSPPPSTWLLPT